MQENPGLTQNKENNMRVIGLTGGVGSGKSLILSILKEDYNADVIMADQVAKEIMELGRPGYEAVTGFFGTRILKKDGSIDRTVLAGIIFQDENARKKVDGAIHPLVWKTIRNQISASQAPLIVVEFAIMSEEMGDSFDEMWYVYTSEENRLRRLEENRGYTRTHSEHIMASQASEAEFRAHCSRVIDNNGSAADVRVQLAKILKDRGQK